MFQGFRKSVRTIATTLVIAGIGLTLADSAAAVPTADGHASSGDRPLGPAEIRLIAREAYVWGWPLVYLHNCRVALQRVPAPGRSGGMPVAPLNRLSMLHDRIPARATAVPCPNQDVLYGFGMFDLEADAVVLQVLDGPDAVGPEVAVALVLGAVRGLAMRKIGGQTGDVCGTAQVMTETAMLAVFAAASLGA
jgi:hypothetical protein